MNTLRTVGTYAAGAAAAAVIADYGYEKYLHAKALKCMQDNQLAIEFSAAPDFSRGERDLRFDFNFTVIKVSPQHSEVVGAICVQSRRHGFVLGDIIDLKRTDVNTSVYDNGVVDISSIGDYLCHKSSFGSHKQKLERIAHAVKQLPVRAFSDSSDRFEEWKTTTTVVKRQ